jgi:phage gp46-like protein
MSVRVRINEGGSPQPLLLWDSVWRPVEGFADWSLADADEAQNKGGLRAKSALATAVILALFTDVRCPDDHPLRYLADGDQRGWWGDGIDVRDDMGEAPLGSLLWLLERAPLTSEIVSRWAPTICKDALAPLMRQRAVTRIEVETSASELQSRLEILVRLYGRDGQKVFDERFAAVWQQIR